MVSTSIRRTSFVATSSLVVSITAGVAAVLSDTTIADDAEITFDIDTAGTGAIGPIISIQVRWL